MKKFATLLILLTTCANAATANAADAHAPKGARADWLPSDTWVMSSWLPFDEDRLYATIHTTRDDLRVLLDDRRSIEQVARTNGWTGTTAALAQTLVAPRLRTAAPTMRR